MTELEEVLGDGGGEYGLLTGLMVLAGVLLCFVDGVVALGMEMRMVISTPNLNCRRKYNNAAAALKRGTQYTADPKLDNIG